MCDQADFTYDVQDERRQRARKEHTCCACDETIREGDLYNRSFTVGDGYANAYKHCLRCWAMLEAVTKALEPGSAIAWELNCGEDWLDTIGELPDEVAALAFMTADDMQQKLTQVRGLEAKS